MTNSRKVFGLTLLAVLVVTFAAACGSSGPSIVGEWEGEYEGDVITMIFDDQGNVTVSAYGSAMAGTYTVDTSTDPHHIDIVFPGGGTIETIFEFVGENTLHFQNNLPGDPRPTSFDDSLEMTRQ